MKKWERPRGLTLALGNGGIDRAFLDRPSAALDVARNDRVSDIQIGLGQECVPARTALGPFVPHPRRAAFAVAPFDLCTRVGVGSCPPPADATS